MVKRVAILRTHNCILERVVARRSGPDVPHYERRPDELGKVSQVDVAPRWCDKLKNTASLGSVIAIKSYSEAIAVDSDVTKVLLVFDSRME